VGIVKLFFDAYGTATHNIPHRRHVPDMRHRKRLCVWMVPRHGGIATVSKKEIVVHSLLLIIALVISFRIGGMQNPLCSLPMQSLSHVLPFKNMSGNAEDEYFSDGITEDILTQLCKIGDLRVVSRTSIMKYKETQIKKWCVRFAAELCVGTILEGSVRRAGNAFASWGNSINARPMNICGPRRMTERLSEGHLCRPV